MNITDRKRICRFDKEQIIKDIVKISENYDSHKYELETELDEYLYEYDFFKYENTKNKFNVYRFSFSIYIIIILFLGLFILPLRWIITGNYYVSGKSKFAKFISVWYDRIQGKKCI